MKRLLLFLLPLTALVLTSCHDDDDMPNVDVSVSYVGATQVNDQLYVVRADSFAITDVTLTAINASHNAGTTSVQYSIDGMPLAFSSLAPFAIQIPIERLADGSHVLMLQMPILEEGCEVANGLYFIKFTIVETADEIPGLAARAAIHEGTVSGTPTLNSTR